MSVAMSSDFKTLLAVPEPERNFSWDEKFFKLLSQSDVELMTEEPQQGPDSWPYILVQTIDGKKSSNTDYAQEPAQKIFHWLSTRGVGLVVNPTRNPYPDYVFSYGMIWNFRETGYFLRPDLVPANAQQAQADYESHKMTTGIPTEQYLPLYVRKVLKDFFRDQMVLNPKVLMISTDDKNFDLCFSLESIGNPPDSEHAGIAEAIAWFLPTHYSIVLISEKNLPDFVSL